MIILPAVDIKNGQAVRLKQGSKDDVTVFGDDPCEKAKMWQDMGAKALHVVDLDGAFDGQARNYAIVEKICQTLTIPVQLGGGIRDEETAKRYLDLGVNKIIIGTMAVEDPIGFANLCKKYPKKIGVSLDVDDNGVLKTHGWVSESKLTIVKVLPKIVAARAACLIYTDISRDGMKSGPNLLMLEWLSINSPIPVIAAGGISSLSDIKDLYPFSCQGHLEGVISGQALYTGSLDLQEAQNWIDSQDL
ncbi:MAG: 1-(5-phosphoribosyl)-5-[Desulfovibrionaceae bacterium]|nr:1-(5-phosphoribosyl)-5-[(5-phosphoribosylamino)methylideneamino]imidazole-4-carboxamide isomerase [Desulfovibrionaceae bacterium]